VHVEQITEFSVVDSIVALFVNQLKDSLDIGFRQVALRQIAQPALKLSGC
jgi:hypothetical protein